MGDTDQQLETAESRQTVREDTVSSDIWKSMDRQSPAKVQNEPHQEEIDFSRAPVLYAQTGGETLNQGDGRTVNQSDGKTVNQVTGEALNQQSSKDEKIEGRNYSQDVLNFHRNAGAGVELLDSSKTMHRSTQELSIIKDMLSKGGLGIDDQLRAAQVLINNKVDNFTDAKGYNFKIELTNAADRQTIRVRSGANGQGPLSMEGSLSNTGKVLEVRTPARQSQDRAQATDTTSGGTADQSSVGRRQQDVPSKPERGLNLQGAGNQRATGDDYSKKVVEFHRNQTTGNVEIPDASKAMNRTASELKAIQDVIANKESSSGDKLRAAQLLARHNVKTLNIDGVDYKIELSDVTSSGISNSGLSSSRESVKLMQVTNGKATELVSGQLTKTGELLDANGQKIQNLELNKQVLPGDSRPSPGDSRVAPGADTTQPYQGKPLFNPALTPEERIKEADRMFKNGERTVTGPDGKVYEIREQKYGNRTAVGIFGKDEQGRERPILRGIVEQDGKVNRQTDRKGKSVDYVSDYGKRNPNSPLVKTEQPPERTERPPRQEDPANEKPSDKVKRLVEKLEPPEDRPKFLTDMQKFEERARRDNIPQEEVDKTYTEIARLMEAQEGKVPVSDRQLLAKNLMYHLGEPTNIDQGQHNTCNVTTIAERMATRNPSKYAEMATTVALDGQWTAADGKVVKIDSGSLVPGGEENRHPPVDGARSFATQLHNLAMVNDIKQREMPPKFYRQERPSGSNRDTGERLYYENGQPADGKVPGVNISQMAEFLKRTTGDTGVLIVDRQHASPDMVSINSPEELAAKLKQMQSEGKMPPILLIDANDRLFFNGPPERNGNWHVVSVTGYDERSGMVTISNQWGRPEDRRIPLADLYRSMNLRRT